MIGNTDDSLLAEIRMAFAQADPVPAQVLAAGKSALSWADPDAALAELTGDSVLEDSAIRDGPVPGPATARLLTFFAPRISIELEADHDGTRRAITGRVDLRSDRGDAADGPVEVLVCWHGGEVRCRLDDSGHFTASGIPAGLIRLRLALADAGSVVTSWIKV